MQNQKISIMIFTNETDEVGLPTETPAKVSECHFCKNDIDELEIMQERAFIGVEIQKVKDDGFEIEEGEVIKVDLCHFCKSNSGGDWIVI